MKRETLKMPVFVYAQSWYKPEACSECPEFNFVLLPEGAAAFCDNVEDAIFLLGIRTGRGLASLPII